MVRSLSTLRSATEDGWSVVSRHLRAILAVLTVAILGYCLVSAVNPRATYDPGTDRFTYYDGYIHWLPHSFDSSRTWFAFWSYLGLACSFWAVRDWLLGKAAAEQRPERRGGGSGAQARTEFFPARLRRLFWLLAINGGLLGLEAIIQRLEGSGKLLFLVRPQIHKTAATQFGPYAYYANASQYFNLLWPGCLGFWWMLHLSRGSKRYAHHFVLLCCAIMAACPIISTSRGGALVTVGMLCVAAVFLGGMHLFFPAHHQETRRTRAVMMRVLALFFVGALALGFALGWKALAPRMAQLREGYQLREQDYDRARPIAADYPVFGTGPGTFESVSQLYRPSTAVNWFVQLHNDWLETRITFGWVGSSLIALALAAVILRWFVPGGIHGGRRFVGLIWLALAGCLIHARFDFPFQVHSIVFLFLILCATLFNLSRNPV
jgi:O-Antigen ligase